MKLEVKNLTKNFGDNNVLKGINFEAKSGKAIGILGRNGAGKTTTIRIVMGVFPSDSGTVLIDGNPINRDKVTFGYLPEERGLYPKKVIIEQLTYFGILKGMKKSEAIKSADYWLGRLEMTEYRNRKLETLSKGNSQKIQLIAAVISNPDIVILDEPFSGLDPVNSMLLKDVVRELIANNKIVFFSSHQMNYIEEFCDDILILNDGAIAISGSIKDIKRGYDRNKIIIHTDVSDINELHSTLKTKFSYECNVEKDYLVVHLKSSHDKNKLFTDLASCDMDIDEVKVYEPTLSDIFVEYTQEGE